MPGLLESHMGQTQRGGPYVIEASRVSLGTKTGSLAASAGGEVGAGRSQTRWSQWPQVSSGEEDPQGSMGDLGCSQVPHRLVRTLNSYRPQWIVAPLIHLC